MKATMKTLLTALFAFALPVHAAHAKCPLTGSKKAPTVYGIGGSTMGTLLGPMLDKVFEENDVEFRRWGKASSGLARPDFHDWPKATPELMQKHKPAASKGIYLKRVSVSSTMGPGVAVEQSSLPV